MTDGNYCSAFKTPTQGSAAKILMVRKSIRALASLVAIYALTIPISAQSVRGSGQDVISRARSEYYNLTRQGFDGFRATIEPNWEVILGHTATAENLKVFRALRFSMTVDTNGAVAVSYEVADTERARVEPYVRQIHDNVQRLLAGFFGTWAIFVVSSPFPSTDSQIKIENAGKEYQLFYNRQSADVMLTMTDDLLVAEWKLTGPGGKRTVKPLFQKTGEGLLLSGYHSVFEPLTEGLKTTLDVNIEYQDVGGMKLPHMIRIGGMHGSEPVEAELRFNQYVLNPRPDNQRLLRSHRS